MIRFLLALFGRSYEAYEKCKTCEILREQLEYERSEKAEMLGTLTSLLKPVPIIQSGIQEPKPISPSGMVWSRRRAELEKQDRERMRVQTSSPVIARPDKELIKEDKGPKTVDQLEHELGVVESEGIH